MPSRFLPPVVAFTVALAVLLPMGWSLPQHGDERMYVWKAAYYGEMLSRFDFGRASGPDVYRDPRWNPRSFWLLEQPLGSHLIYALALGVTRSPTPSAPWDWYIPALQGSDTDIPPNTLPVVRGTAALCAALGLALIVYRIGWPALIAISLLLAIPHVRTDLARAWAEGPLLLGLGMCALTYGSRWFGLACGVAASLKLTALMLWPLTLTGASGRSRLARVFGLPSAIAGFIATCPSTWMNGGPFYLLVLTAFRLSRYAWQSGHNPTERYFGLFLPSRYLWPIELGLLLMLTYAAAHWAEERRPGHRLTPLA